jgi:hypothetical protein
MAKRNPFSARRKIASRDDKLSAPELRQKRDEERQRAIARFMADGGVVKRDKPELEDDSRSRGA